MLALRPGNTKQLHDDHCLNSYIATRLLVINSYQQNRSQQFHIFASCRIHLHVTHDWILGNHMSSDEGSVTSDFKRNNFKINNINKILD